MTTPSSCHDRLRPHHLEALRESGMFLIPNFFSEDEVSEAVRDIRALFADVAMVAKRTADPRLASRDAPREFGGTLFDAVEFPFEARSLNALGCHPAVIRAAQQILNSPLVRMDWCAATAKFAGHRNYSQPLHRDTKVSSLLVPSREPRFMSVGFLVYLSDVDEGCGPTSYVPFKKTGHLSRWDGVMGEAEHPELLAEEVHAVGPTGSIFVFLLHSIHRGTNLLKPGADRYQISCSFHTEEGAGWLGGNPWPRRAYLNWKPFLSSANVEQLSVIGIPPPGHPYWTPETLHDVAERHPYLNLNPYVRACK